LGALRTISVRLLATGAKHKNGDKSLNLAQKHPFLEGKQCF
jgi:hypothetical protein